MTSRSDGMFPVCRVSQRHGGGVEGGGVRGFPKRPPGPVVLVSGACGMGIDILDMRRTLHRTMDEPRNIRRITMPVIGNDSSA